VHNLGVTRGAQQRNHFLQTPDTFIRAPLPGMRAATAIVHVAPANGAAFTQYTAEMQFGGTLGPTAGQRFLYVLEGTVTLGEDNKLEKDGYVYLPAGVSKSVVASAQTRLAVIEKPYLSLAGFEPPAFLTSHASAVPTQPLLGDESVQVRALLPETPAHDFAVNLMTFEPGATLPLTEMHIMEHGLLLLEGGGIYRLGDCWYPVSAGDFIWMAPFCPQWFGALGKSPAQYLLYKDWNRHPLERSSK
jgi:(S)-ureidoglycine aminohydrolase